MRRIKGSISAILLTIFLIYWGEISLFHHSHIIDGSVVTHSHSMGGSSREHDHTRAQFNAIALLSIFLSLVVFSRLFIKSPNCVKFNYFEYSERNIYLRSLDIRSLRAPPVFSF